MLRINLNEFKTLGRSLRSLSSRTPDVTPASFDGDGDGMRTGPDGRDNVPVAKPVESLTEIAEKFKNKPLKERQIGLVQYVRQLSKNNTPSASLPDLQRAFNLTRPQTAKAINAADPLYIEKHNEYKKIVEADRIERLTELWNSGSTMKEIAEELGLTRDQVLGLRKKLDLPVRRRGRIGVQKQKVKLRGEQVNRSEREKVISQVNNLRAAGYSDAQIAEKLDLTVAAVSGYTSELRNRGQLKPRPSKEERAMNMARDGMTVVEIAKRIQIPRSEVVKIIEEAGGVDGLEMGVAPKRPRGSARAVRADRLVESSKKRGKLEQQRLAQAEAERRRKKRRREELRWNQPGSTDEFYDDPEFYQNDDYDDYDGYSSLDDDLRKELPMIKIDLKSLGKRTLGRAISGGKPNVGKNPKDGDGDGFVVNLNTGMDDVPVSEIPDNVRDGYENLREGGRLSPEARRFREAGKLTPGEQPRELVPFDGSGGKTPTRFNPDDLLFMKKPDGRVPRALRNPDNRYDNLETSEVQAALGMVAYDLEKNPFEAQREKAKKNLDDITKSLKKRGFSDGEIQDLMRDEKKKAEDLVKKWFDEDPEAAAQRLEREARINPGGFGDGKDPKGDAARARRWADYVARGGKLSEAEWDRRDRQRNPGPQPRVQNVVGPVLPDRKKPARASDIASEGARLNVEPPKAGGFELRPVPDDKVDPDSRYDKMGAKELFDNYNLYKKRHRELRAWKDGEAPMPRIYRLPNGAPGEDRRQANRAYVEALQEWKKIEDSLRRRGYDDPEKARLEYNRSKRKK